MLKLLKPLTQKSLLIKSILEIFSPKRDHWTLIQLYDIVAQRYRCGDVIRVVDKWRKLEAI